MRRLLPLLVLAAALAAAAPSAAAPLFLPSHQTPNIPGSLRLPLPLSTPPAVPEVRSYDALLALWQEAGAAYGVPWQVLAAINKIESNLGRNMGPSSAGALGWMQFMPETWNRWGMDANGDGVASPWNPEDGVYSAARYLAAAGAHDDLYRAVYAYNHAHWYVRDVLELAELFGEGAVPATAGGTSAPVFEPPLVFAVDDLEQRLERARRRITATKRALVRLEKRIERLGWTTAAAERAAGDPELSDGEFEALEAGITALLLEREDLGARLERRRQALVRAAAALDELEEEASAISFSRPVGRALSGAQFADGSLGGEYVFPVGGGAGLVSVSSDHHDYPAADIAAPEGSPLYALSGGVVLDSWPSPSGRCGIGFRLRLDAGPVYVYCHLAYLDPGVVPGAALAAGASVGLVGSTGRSSGPHLHLQLSPASAYPQREPWFRSFAGTAFSWRGAPPPAAAPAPPRERVFTVVLGA